MAINCFAMSSRSGVLLRPLHCCRGKLAPLRLRARSTGDKDSPGSIADTTAINGGAGQNGGVALSEDVLARLRAAEEEAQRLREQLAAVQGSSQAVVDAIDQPRRIDSGDLRRETIFTMDSERRNWLSESDVDFFTATSGTSTKEPSSEEQDTIKRRLLLGLIAAVGLGAFALVPTSDLRRPTKPLSFYVVALLRVQSLLLDLKDVIANGEWGTLAAALNRIYGNPNNIRDSLYSAAALLASTQTRQQAEAVATELLDFLVDMDYNKYFDAMPKAVDGAKQAEFAAFSEKGRLAALAKIDEFLALIPESDRTAARQLLASY